MKKTYLFSIIAIFLMMATSACAEDYLAYSWEDLRTYMNSSDRNTKTCKLMADIDFNGGKTEPLVLGSDYVTYESKYETWFCIDGNGHTIKNGTMKEGYMIFYTAAGTIRNMTFEGLTSSDAILAYSAGTGCHFENLTFNNCTITGDDYFNAVVCAKIESKKNSPVYFTNITVKNCSVDGLSCNGAIMGCSDYWCEFTNCHVSSTTILGGTDVAGIAGFARWGYFDNCSFDGKVYADGGLIDGAFCGGIVGHLIQGEVKNCINNGEIVADEDYVGGIIGAGETITVTGCKNTGWVHHENLTGTDDGIAGIIGSAKDVTISKCVNTGSIDGGDAYCGGIAGLVEGNSSITHCVNGGFVNGDEYVGGIAGQTKDGTTVSFCIGASNRIEGGDCTEILVGAEPVGSTHDNYWISETSNINVGAVTKEDLMSGKVTWHINNKANLPENVWTQNLETDDFPVIGNKGVHYARTMANDWGTVILPYDVNYSQSNGNYKLYKLGDVSLNGNEGALTFTEYENGTIAAGTPMAVKKLSGDGIDIMPSSTPNYSTTITPVSDVTGWTMTGTYSNLTEQTGIYFIAQDKFWWAEEGTTIPPFRAWFAGPVPSSNSAKVLNIVIADDATGISEVRGESLELRDSKHIENGKVVIIRNGKKYNTAGQAVR